MFSIKNLKTFNKYFNFSDLVLLLSFIIVGGFNDFLSCLISVALLFNLFIKIKNNCSFKININLLSVSVFCVVIFYGLTVFWALDSGMAFIGFLKFLPILIYLVLLQQSDKNGNLFNILPRFVSVLVIISSVCSFIPPIKDLFLVSERLSGFFQYPNSFAILLLISELLILKKEKLYVIDFITVAVLIGGMLYTGSRTVFLLFLASNFLLVSVKLSKKKRILVFGIAFLLIASLLGVALLGPEGNLLSRYLKIGLTQSTFVGRLLYMSDALPLLIKYPFGMGYFGYHYIQGSIQTGVYNVSYVHNDIMQIALDVGIIPAILFFSAIVAFFFKKNISFTDKLILAVFTLHNMFDFNLQFIGMFMLYILLLNDNSGKELTFNNITAFKFALPIIIIINIYMCIPLALSQFTAYKASDLLYPYNTRNKLILLEQQEDVNVANDIANEILEYNEYYYAPYSIKAKYYYSKGNFMGVINSKKEVFSKYRFRYTEYKEYGIMLANGIIAYDNMGDSKSSQILRNELSALKTELEKSGEYISKLGSMINEQPVLELPENILSYIDNNQEGAGGLN